MRIIAGQWRGRRLSTPSGPELRPTTDRVKSALFSLLGERIDGAVVADLCCGVGNLGLEALSRGARQVFFVDNRRAALQYVRRNLELCGATRSTYRVQRADAEQWLRSRLAPGAAGVHIVLADPPYDSDLATRLCQVLGEAVARSLWELAVLEHGDETQLELPAGLPLFCQRRKYGKTVLFILEAKR
ncbi:MAG: 16S rRNA (guanine(966)-N(2))-methyltransferase RsmD [bacterium]